GLGVQGLRVQGFGLHGLHERRVRRLLWRLLWRLVRRLVRIIIGWFHLGRLRHVFFVVLRLVVLRVFHGRFKLGRLVVQQCLQGLGGLATSSTAVRCHRPVHGRRGHSGTVLPTTVLIGACHPPRP